LTCLRAPTIAALAADDGPSQMTHPKIETRALSSVVYLLADGYPKLDAVATANTWPTESR
jgi:hypothetical protein